MKPDEDDIFVYKLLAKILIPALIIYSIILLGNV